jgi:hypothetical protein
VTTHSLACYGYRTSALSASYLPNFCAQHFFLMIIIRITKTKIKTKRLLHSEVVYKPMQYWVKITEFSNTLPVANISPITNFELFRLPLVETGPDYQILLKSVQFYQQYWA